MPAHFFLLRIELMHSQPKIWRRVFVPADIPLTSLHRVLQTAMGWYGIARWYFTFRQRIIHDEACAEQPPAEIPLCSQVHRRGMTFQYVCRFDDVWKHRITLSNSNFDASQYDVAIACVAGEQACPPINVGGVKGYYAFLQAIADPEHPDHYDMKDWVGEDFDRDVFHPEQVNADLARMWPPAGPA